MALYSLQRPQPLGPCHPCQPVLASKPPLTVLAGHMAKQDAQGQAAKEPQASEVRHSVWPLGLWQLI